jgi:cell division protein FtsB
MLEQQMQEMRELPERMTALESQILQLRHEMRDEFSAVRSEFRGELAGAVATLTQAIADTNAQMRTLHEESLSRIATIGEGRRRMKKR